MEFIKDFGLGVIILALLGSIFHYTLNFLVKYAESLNVQPEVVFIGIILMPVAWVLGMVIRTFWEDYERV